jgi:hypothetical protein
MPIEDDAPSAEKIENLAKKIWLAGLGAYGRSLDNVQTGYDKISGESLKVFEELVSKGEALQNETANEVKDKVKGKVKEGKDRFEARAEELKTKLSITSGINTKLDSLSKKIDQLSKKLTKKA